MCSRCGIPVAPAKRRREGGWFDRLAALRVEATLVVILANVGLFVACYLVQGGLSKPAGGLVPIGGFRTGVLERMGALSRVRVEDHGEWWRLVTACWLHVGLVHILLNCVVIRLAGQAVERAFGPAKFLALYVLMGTAASFTSYLWYPAGGPPSVGASGGAIGLLAMAGVYAHRRGVSRTRSVMLGWALVLLVFGFAFGADNAAHVGGLVVGVALGLFVAEAERTRESRLARRLWDLAAVAAIALVLFCFGQVALA